MVNKVVIVGTDEIGPKIRDLFSKAGLEVVLAKRGSVKELSDADMVVEVMPRKEALRKCEVRLSPTTILATTAPGGVTEIASVMTNRERVIGLNFIFNPLEEKCLVQIVKGLETSEEVVKTCQSLVEKAGATAVTVDDVPGLIVNRTLASVINEAATMYLAKVATIEDIDKTCKLCLNWPMGPFEFADYIGIDKVLATLEAASQYGMQYLPCRLLRQMVAAGQLGKKTGKGFYTYSS